MGPGPTQSSQTRPDPTWVTAMQDFDPTLPELLREDPRDRDKWMRVALWFSVSFWLILAVLFWTVPFVSGIPFILLALVTLAMASPRFAQWVNSWERYLPHRWRVALRSGVRATGTGCGRRCSDRARCRRQRKPACAVWDHGRAARRGGSLMVDLGDIRVHDVMRTDVVALDADAPIREAVRTLEELHLHAAPVIDDAGRLLGVLSASDIVQESHLQDDRISTEHGDFAMVEPATSSAIPNASATRRSSRRTITARA